MSNKKYKICVVGAGRWGLNHIKTLISLNTIVGVVDENDLAIKKIKETYPNCIAFESLDRSFKYEFDAYIVSTPSNVHFQIAKKIIEKGKPVLVEKPIALKLDDAVKLNDLAKKKNVNLMVGHLLLFHPAFKKIKELIDNKTLGEVQYIYSNRLNLGSFRNDENVLLSFAPHDISLFNYFFNELPRDITSVGVDILQKGIHDTSITSFKYNGNRMGHIFVSWLHPFKEHRFIVVGSKGMVHFEDASKNKPLIFYDKTVDLKSKIPKSISGASYKIDYDDQQPLKEELKYFISKIEKGSIDVADGNSAVEVMKVLDKATKSMIN
jgi:UDP-2-acetamido-3-amino-2,3-dideoxy-glucuronate N-acetyltransferase